MLVHHPSSFAPFFLLAELLLGRAEEPFPFLFYFADGSAGYTNGINLLCNGLFHVSVLLVKLSVNLLCKMPLFASTFSVIIVNSLVVKFGFLFLFSALFPVSSSGSMSARPSLPSQRFIRFIHRQLARVALNFPPNLFVMWESPLLVQDLFLE